MRQKQHLTGLGIILIFALPLVFAWVGYQHQDLLPKGTTNHGQLINPPIYGDEMVLTEHHGKTFTLNRFHGKWLLFYLNTAPCRGVCKKQLQYLQQIQIALGKDRDRLQELYISPVKKELEILRGHFRSRAPNLRFAFTKPSAQLAFFHAVNSRAQKNTQRPRIYLVDPLGNIMMAYEADVAPQDILKDVKKLLKVSQIG